MKYFKKLLTFGLCLALSLNLVACKNKNIIKSEESSVADSCNSVDFSNINYNNYSFKGISFECPSFLGVSKEDDNFISLATKDSSVSLKVYKERSGTNFRNLYEYDMSSLKNINYDSYKDTRFSISGTDNDFEYYKSSILLGHNIFSFMFIYPVEYLDEFDSIVTNVYKAFVANLDGSGEQNKDVAGNSNVSKNTNKKLQVATIDSESSYSAKLVPLGDYIEGKEYNYEYCKILGTNIINNKTINDSINYNTVYHHCGSIKYPDFMIPNIIPENLKNVDFISRDGQFYVNIGYHHNIEEYNLSSYLNNLKEIYNCLYSNINDGKAYFAGTSMEDANNKIILFCSKVNEYNILDFRLEFTKDYYYSHKETINSIFKEMDNSFYTVDTNDLP